MLVRPSRPHPCAAPVQSLSLASASKLLSLVELFASPRFLLARPGNAAFAGQLLESINNSLQYQYETNPTLGACATGGAGREGSGVRSQGVGVVVAR